MRPPGPGHRPEAHRARGADQFDQPGELVGGTPPQGRVRDVHDAAEGGRGALPERAVEEGQLRILAGDPFRVGAADRHGRAVLVPHGGDARGHASPARPDGRIRHGRARPELQEDQQGLPMGVGGGGRGGPQRDGPDPADQRPPRADIGRLPGRGRRGVHRSGQEPADHVHVGEGASRQPAETVSRHELAQRGLHVPFMRLAFMLGESRAVVRLPRLVSHGAFLYRAGDIR
ncbi:hypothetical protein GCM10010187_30730 [Actinomadura coerulea]|nr:hypothetical protein GCM10010187_30730 [Actinomadura coerulea]